MRRITVFNHVSLDGFFCDTKGDMSWAHRANDAEWLKFTAENARGDSAMIFGRVTYEMMASAWTTASMKKAMPEVAARMNGAQKIVFSRRLKEATWENTRLVNGDLIAEVKKLKKSKGPDFVIFGSGTVIAQLAAAGLIDTLQLVVNPLVLGDGRTMFNARQNLKLVSVRQFKNGNVLSCYEPLA